MCPADDSTQPHHMSIEDVQALLLASTQSVQAQMEAMAQRIEDIASGTTAGNPGASTVVDLPPGSALPVCAGGPSDYGPHYAPAGPAPCVPEDEGIDAVAFSKALQSMLTPHQPTHASMAAGGFMMVGTFLSTKVKTLIRQGQYVELGLMEPKASAGPEQRNARWASNQSASAAISFTPPKVARAANKDQWLRWFSTFAAIYTEVFHDAAPQMFLYIVNINRMFETHSFKQVLEYDEQFRLAKSVDPSLPWHKLELQILSNTSVLMPGNQQRSISSSSTAGSAAGSSRTANTCNAYNSRQQFCENKACRYAHVCSSCRQKHPRYKCTRETREPRAETTSTSTDNRKTQAP